MGTGNYGGSAGLANFRGNFRKPFLAGLANFRKNFRKVLEGATPRGPFGLVCVGFPVRTLSVPTTLSQAASAARHAAWPHQGTGRSTTSTRCGSRGTAAVGFE